MPGLNLCLRGTDETRILGRAIAEAALRASPGAILLYGELGAGKTLLTEALVRALPGGGEAEVSSPSFTVCNMYDTVPPVRHFDLYRLEAGYAGEELEESLDDPAVLTVVEWPERAAWPPENAIICRLSRGADENVRRAELRAAGPAGGRCLALLTRMPLLHSLKQG